MEIFELHLGSTPLLISLPHDGSLLPDALAARMTPSARRAPDTDWFVRRLYAFTRKMGASLLVPRYSRYVVDLNRPPDDESLYPGQHTTGLCPTVQFNGESVYLPGEEPAVAEIGARIDHYWRPYHDALRMELARLHAAHGRVLLWEAHSIRSVLPLLFEGTLPDLNLGTADGASCTAATQWRIEQVLAAQSDFGWVSNGRFKGGYITRHYGQPSAGVEAVQLELAQCNYMDEDRAEFDPGKAARLQRLLDPLLRAAMGG